jgi:hypothetical protein
VREMSIDENYERNITPIRSEISRFSRGTIVTVDMVGQSLTGSSVARSKPANGCDPELGSFQDVPALNREMTALNPDVVALRPNPPKKAKA